MNSKTHKYIATIVLFLLFLTLFFYLTFPTEALKKRVEAEIENKTGFHAEISKIAISPFLELKITDLNLEKKEKDINVKIDKLKLKPSIFSLLLDKKSFPFDAEIGEGKIYGTLVYASKTNVLDSLSADLSNIHTDLITTFTKSGKNSPVFDGSINGKLNIIFADKKSGGVSGNFNFISNNMSIKKLKFEGLNLLLIGSMPLLWDIKKGGKLDLSLNLNFKSDAAKMGLLQAFMKKEKDGSLSAKIAGTPSKPKFVKSEKL
jgi:type II secretion system protein N